ncbi:unnamed protein product [Dibothriocephalus latus]|uniref:Uncharacterized protein n=1 Tax=Dibothriocephalus latus TaxID=60516 RepID=A0A3P7LSN7_DIBLA|nr:unnamed protein product [Dibothriocephalus latus]
MEPFGADGPEALNPYIRVIIQAAAALLCVVPKINNDFEPTQRSPVPGLFAGGEMTIPRSPRRYSISRPWKTSRRTILLTPSFLYELQAWCKENVRTAPLSETPFSTAGEEDSCGIKNDLTTNASAATDTPEVVSPAVRTAAICYPFKPASRRKPSLKITGKTLRIIDDCPVLILQMTRITCKLPTLIIAPDGKSDKKLFRPMLLSFTASTL